MDYPLALFSTETHTDEGQRKAGHLTSQVAQSPMEPLEGSPLHTL